jgi:hypothetical protein
MAEELRTRIMQYVFDLSGRGIRKLQFFPDAVAAFAIPEALEETLSLLVWGVVFPQPEQDADFCKRLRPAVQQAVPTALYLSGWGALIFRGVQSGKMDVWPYEPTLELQDLRFPPHTDTSVPTLSRRWPGTGQAGGTDYVFSMVLEQPLAFLSLTIVAAGPVTLTVNPQDFVTEAQLERSPEQYRSDLTRRRQLASLVGLEGEPSRQASMSQ